MVSLSGATSVINPTLLSRMNERQVLRAIQAHGPMSRAEVARYSGISAPTASKAVESLLRSGWLEEGEAPELMRGRPARKLRLPERSAQVLGLVIDRERCRMVSAGLDGNLLEERDELFPTPSDYAGLLRETSRVARQMMSHASVRTLGMGISLPGLMDYSEQRSLLSPNVPITNGHTPAHDLSKLLEIPCAVFQESHALCLAERYYGNARGLDNFAMLDASNGVGLGVMSGGQLLTGHRGLAGEVGHITVVADGRPCGCGNTGCLETVACDAALAWAESQRLGRKISVDSLMARLAQGHEIPGGEQEAMCSYLAIGVAAVINLFNPATLFVHNRVLAGSPALFERMTEQARSRALPPSFADCRIVLARGSKRQGAVAGIIEHLLAAAFMLADTSSPFAFAGA